MIRILATCIILFTAIHLNAQDDLLNELATTSENFPTVIFNGTRLINGHSVETKHKGELEFIITHRFGYINSGGYNLWGLDDASIRLGLEYGITDKLGIGVGRSSYDKSFDYYLKYKLLQQREGVPVTLSLFGSLAYNASLNVSQPELATSDKLAYVTELLLARKFSPWLSLQLMPVWVHKNTVDQAIAENDVLAIGFGGRIKVTKTMALMGEYYHRLNENENTPYYNSLGLGVEFDTGGHIFQLVFTNSVGMFERAFITETDGDFSKGDVRFGFNITRTFQLTGKK